LNYVVVNQILRKLIQDLIDTGYKKTIIGKLLLGQSGYIPMIDFLDHEERSFGVKPLSRLAEVLEYDMHVVFIEKSENSKDIVDNIDQINNEFFESLKTNVTKLLVEMRTEEGEKKFHIKKKRKSDIELILNQFLGEENIGTKLE
jgi:hypothetical protein